MEIISDDEMARMGYMVLRNPLQTPEIERRREIMRATLTSMGAANVHHVPQDQRPLVKAMLMHWLKSDQPKNQGNDMQHSIKTLSDRIEQRKSDLERANTHLREMNDAVSAQINLVRKIEAEVAELEQAICVLKGANNEL